jgi:hypothetical protein
MARIKRGAAAHGNPTLLRTAVAVLLALATTGCQPPGSTANAGATTPRTPFNPTSLTNLTQGNGNGSLLGTNTGKKQPQVPVPVPRPKPKPTNDPADPAKVVGDKGTDGNGTFPDADNSGLTPEQQKIEAERQRLLTAWTDAQKEVNRIQAEIEAFEKETPNFRTNKLKLGEHNALSNRLREAQKKVAAAEAAYQGQDFSKMPWLNSPL